MQDIKIAPEEFMRLRNEIIIAEKLNEDKLLTQMREALQRYTGRHVPAIGMDWDIVLNEVYPIIQYELPSIFFRNPKVYLKPRNKNYICKKTDPLTGAKVDVVMDSSKSARTQEALLNYTLAKCQYKRETQKVLLDALLFKHGVLWHGYKGSFGMTDEQSIYIEEEQIFVRRISPMRFLFDPTVTIGNLDEARWIARSFDVSLHDLQEDERLNVDKELKGKPGFAITIDKDVPRPDGNGGFDTRALSSKTRTLLDYTDEDYQKSKFSRFVRIYEILKRPTPKEKRSGEKGKIVLYTPEQKKPLRVNAWPYKAEGWPGKVLMFNEVPDSIFGLSDIEVYGTIADHKNAVVNLQLRNAESNSKVIIAFDKSNMDEETIQKIEGGQQNVIGMDGKPGDKISIASPGGQASGELYMLDQRIQANLDEKSGITDLKKGFLRSGEESAKSVEIRNAGASARPSYRQDIMADFLRGSTEYLNDLVKQFLPYDEAVRLMGSLDIAWSEAPTKEEIQADVDAELDVISMLPENPEKEIQELTTILNLMTSALGDPAVFAKLQQEGYTFSLAPIIENLLLRLKIRDPEVFRHLRPEESAGFASVNELKEAQANTEAAVTGQDPPFPAKEGQDHAARMAVYTGVARIFQLEGRVSDILNQLILTQQAVAELESEQKSPREGQPMNLSKPSNKPIGA